MTLIIDISNNNPHVDMSAVRAAGCWHKAGQGDYYVDSYYEPRRKAATVPFAPYWFADNSGGRDPEKQCDYFIDHSHAPKDGDLRAMVDYEPLGSATPSRAWLEAFLSRYQKRTTHWPCWYAPTSWANEMTGSAILKRCAYVRPDYSTNDGARHPFGSACAYQAAAHQFTSVGSAHGVSGSCDISYALAPSKLFIPEKAAPRTYIIVGTGHPAVVDQVHEYGHGRARKVFRGFAHKSGWQGALVLNHEQRIVIERVTTTKPPKPGDPMPR